MKIKREHELSDFEKLILNKSRSLAQHMWDYFTKHTDTFLKNIIKHRGCIEQVMVATYFSETASNIVCGAVLAAKQQLDTCEDGEHSRRSLLDEIFKGCELKLGLVSTESLTHTETLTSKESLDD